MLPTRWRVTRTEDPHPIIGSVAKSSANRSHQDVARFFVYLVLIAQTVIKEIALPIYAMFSSAELFPVLDGCRHSGFTRKRDDCVQMIRHQQTQSAMPNASFMVELHRFEHTIADVCAAQLVLPARHAVNGDEKPTTVGYPLWNRVR